MQSDRLWSFRNAVVVTVNRREVLVICEGTRSSCLREKVSLFAAVDGRGGGCEGDCVLVVLCEGDRMGVAV